MVVSATSRDMAGQSRHRRPNLTAGSIPAQSDKPDNRLANFGLRPGTKVSRVVAMFEHGCTMKEVCEAVGTNQYNVLRRLEAQGHDVINQDGKIKLIFRR